MKYRADIDGLRAVAVVSVVLFHAHVPGISGGFVGVDVFFVISGYLICSLIAGELSAGKFSIVQFYERRCRRILPALFAMLAIVAALSSVVLLPPDLLELNGSLISSVTFVSNIFFWHNANYFAGASAFKPLLHTWSLGVEEQFYIFMPLILMLLSRGHRPKYALGLTSLAVASFALNVWTLNRAPTADFYLLPTRFWELTVGALGALATPVGLQSRAMREVVGLGGVTLCASAIVLLSEASPFPGWRAALPCMGAALIIYQGRCGTSIVTRALSARPCVFIGQISYSLYLWHWPLLALARYEVATRELTPGEIAGLLLTSFLAAVLSWHFVERPFRNRVRISSPAVVKVCGVASVVLLTMGVAQIRAHGYSLRYPEFKRQHIEGRSEYRASECFLQETQDFSAWRGQECFLTRGHGTNVLLWGDSYAAHYAPGIVDHASHAGADILQFTAIGCAPIFGYYSAAIPHCRDNNDHIPELLTKYHIRAVIMAARWESLFRRGVRPEQVAATVLRLRKLRVAVYVIGQSPLFANDVQVIFAKQDGRQMDPEATAPLAFDPRVNDMLHAALHAGTFIDPLSALCESDSCRYRRDGNFLVVDDGHLSSFGSGLAVAAYFPFMYGRTESTPSLADRGSRHP
ncbi:MAG TPA: acyltransferase family protein [Steroidobacteraceae bacterium]|nr:acyltransferase family protein [Steroidobacteraceae bacterium]